jgi:hypothetical protein
MSKQDELSGMPAPDHPIKVNVSGPILEGWRPGGQLPHVGDDYRIPQKAATVTRVARVLDPAGGPAHIVVTVTANHPDEK